MQRILTINNEQDNAFLHTPTKTFDFDAHSKEEVRKIVRMMRETMTEADGVGLAANQIGLDVKVCVVRHQGKFYALFNPEIVKFSREMLFDKESCLSVPGISVELPRAEKITLIARNNNNRKIKMTVSNMLARIFQHEIDHLNGILMTDKRPVK